MPRVIFPYTCIRKLCKQSLENLYVIVSRVIVPIYAVISVESNFIIYLIIFGIDLNHQFV